MNSGSAPRSPLPAALRPLTVPASRVYAAIIAARNRRYDRGQGITPVDRPVISVGNITTGGTGKTPMVAWIARHLVSAGHRPVIAMRGYKASPRAAGDEHAEYQQVLPDVPVLANPDRIAALREFLPAHPEFDCVILDDGFQHRRLHRDLDLVLIDAQARTLQDDLLPAGHLREPLTSLRRADAVIITHANDIDPILRGEIERWHGRAPLAWSRHRWKHIEIHQTDGSCAQHPIDWLRGKRLVTMLGIGRPASVIEQLEALGAKVMASVPAADHERYDLVKLTIARGLCNGCDALVVTRKDWVKIRAIVADTALKWPCPIVVPALSLEVIEGAEALREMIMEAARAGPGQAGAAG
jgi:tetraacyldisaccharide 4'-kinase